MDVFSSVSSRSIKLKSNNRSSPLSRSNNADYGSLYWTFNPNNHYLSEELAQIVYSKRMLRTLGVSLVVHLLITFSPAPPEVYNAYEILVCICLWIPLMAALLLSMNRDALGFIVKSSDFWIKLVYATVVGILEMILFHRQEQTQQNTVAAHFGYPRELLRFFAWILFVAFVGGTDAIPKMNFKWKVFIIALVAFLCSFAAIEYQLLAPSSEDYLIEIETTGSVVSCHSLLANSFGTLALFMWKAVIGGMCKRDRCVSITYSPYLRWEIPRNESKMVEHGIPVIQEAATSPSFTPQTAQSSRWSQVSDV